MVAGEENLKKTGSENYFENALWHLGDVDNPTPLGPLEVANHRLLLRKNLIDAGLDIPKIESTDSLVDLALTSKLRRMTDRGAVLVTALGESSVVDYVNSLDPQLSKQQRFDALWPRLRGTKIIALRAALQRESVNLPLLESGEEHSARRGPEQLAVDLLTLPLIHPKITPETVEKIVRKMNIRAGKHLESYFEVHRLRDQAQQVRAAFYPPGFTTKEYRQTSEVGSPDVVFALLKDVASTPSDRLADAFMVDQIDPWVLLGNDVKPPKH